MRLLRCIARAVVKNGGRLLCDLVPGGQALYDVAADAWQHYLEESRAESLRAEVQALAQASSEELRGQVQAAVREAAGHEPAEIQLALASYLTQVPAMVRRSLKRPSDPVGQTLPGSRHLVRAEDLLPFLPPQPPRFRPGDLPLPGVDWVLEELLGVGGFGEVWRARHRHLANKPPVALKFCLDEAAARALFNEAGVLDRVMRQGKHDGIVQLQETYLSAVPPCLQYEYVEGGDLAGLIREEADHQRLTSDTGTRLLLQLAQTVAFAHRAGIVHCDLKPANILVQRGPAGEPRLRVADFGIGGVAAGHALQQARRDAAGHHTLLTEAVRGAYTPLYASPQQVQRRRDEPADPRDDVHALGVIWYQLVTGDLGLTALPTDWREQLVERGMSAERVDLLAACVTSREDRRLANAAVLVERLEQPGLPRATPPPLPPARPTPAAFREQPPSASWNRVVLTLALGLALLVPLLFLFGWHRQPDPPAPPRPVKLDDYVRDVLGMKFVRLPPGKFHMGSPEKEAGRVDAFEAQHWVTLTRGYYLGKFEVTQAQWRAVMGDNPSDNKGELLPVDNVSFADCQQFLDKLRDRTGKRYRLPTEAEWEYACRAGTTTPFHFGDTPSLDLANCVPPKGVGHKQSLPVGSHPPNARGLHDMHGNVREWCADAFAPYQGDVTDPLQTQGNARVVRGGAWSDGAEFCRAANRFPVDPLSRDPLVGLRVCLDAD